MNFTNLINFIDIHFMETSRKLAKYDRLYDQIKQYIQTTEDI